MLNTTDSTNRDSLTLRPQLEQVSETSERVEIQDVRDIPEDFWLEASLVGPFAEAQTVGGDAIPQSP
jgi:hypothetical protein